MKRKYIQTTIEESLKKAKKPTSIRLDVNARYPKKPEFSFFRALGWDVSRIIYRELWQDWKKECLVIRKKWEEVLWRELICNTQLIVSTLNYAIFQHPVHEMSCRRYRIYRHIVWNDGHICATHKVKFNKYSWGMAYDGHLNDKPLWYDRVGSGIKVPNKATY